MNTLCFIFQILILPSTKSPQNEIEKIIYLPVKLTTLNQSNSEPERKSFLGINQLKKKREIVQPRRRRDLNHDRVRKIHVDGTTELLGLKSPVLVEYFGQAGVDIVGLAEACSTKITKHVSEYKMNIQDKINENEMYEAQSLGTSYGDEIYKIYYFCRTKLKTAFYDWQVSVNDEVKRRGISIMESSISTNKKYSAFKNNPELQDTINLQKTQLNNLAKEKTNEYKDVAKNGLKGISKIENDSASSIYDLVKNQGNKLRAIADRKVDDEKEYNLRAETIVSNLLDSNDKKYDAILDEMEFLTGQIYAITDRKD